VLEFVFLSYIFLMIFIWIYGPSVVDLSFQELIHCMCTVAGRTSCGIVFKISCFDLFFIVHQIKERGAW
jgi:hypothetical protein